MRLPPVKCARMTCDMKNPYESPKSDPHRAGGKPDTYGRAIVVALVQQVFILSLAALMLDEGRLLHVLSGALIVSWLVSLMVMLRWRDHPTPLSTTVVKYGFWSALILAFLLGPLVSLQIFGG